MCTYLAHKTYSLARVFVAPSALVAEALATRDALVLAYNLDLSCIVVESDSLSVRSLNKVLQAVSLPGWLVMVTKWLTWLLHWQLMVLFRSSEQLNLRTLRLQLLKDRSRAINRVPFPSANINIS